MNRMAGMALLGTGLGAGGLALAQHLAEQAIPMHSREMTQEAHAKNNMGGMRERHPGVSTKDHALFEGLRQGLMSGEITGSELNQLAMSGKLPKDVIVLLTDVHDWSADEPYPFGDRSIPEVVRG
jgi:hypothetical protein